MTEPWIVITGKPETSLLAESCATSFGAALVGDGKMAIGVYTVMGFCGRKFRLFLNNLIGGIEDPRYLEIGVYGGATLCAAIESNAVKAVGVDNWSWGPPDENWAIKSTYTALAAHKPKSSSLSLIESDYRFVPYDALGPFNVLFYDGPHTAKDQYDGVKIPLSAMDKTSIVIVDDWNWEFVRTSTLSAIRDADVDIDFSIDLRTSDKADGSVPEGSNGMHSDWHNGFFAAVIKKK